MAADHSVLNEVSFSQTEAGGVSGGSSCYGNVSASVYKAEPGMFIDSSCIEPQR